MGDPGHPLFSSPCPLGGSCPLPISVGSKPRVTYQKLIFMRTQSTRRTWPVARPQRQGPGCYPGSQNPDQTSCLWLPPPGGLGLGLIRPGSCHLITSVGSGPLTTSPKKKNLTKSPGDNFPGGWSKKIGKMLGVCKQTVDLRQAWRQSQRGQKGREQFAVCRVGTPTCGVSVLYIIPPSTHNVQKYLSKTGA